MRLVGCGMPSGGSVQTVWPQSPNSDWAAKEQGEGTTTTAALETNPAAAPAGQRGKGIKFQPAEETSRGEICFTIF